jgi:sugar phosphate permease
MIYYIGRANLSIAKPLLMIELGITPAVMGLIGTTFFLRMQLDNLSTVS